MTEEGERGKILKKLLKIILLNVIIGYASYYGEGDGFAWKTMANGKPMNPQAMTCASWHYPPGTILEVSHGGRKVNEKNINAHGRNLQIWRHCIKKLKQMGIV